MSAESLEIVCTECGEDTFVRREPVYEGFKKVGETFICTSCGRKFNDIDSVPFKEKKISTILTDADKSPQIQIFDENERRKNCRYCEHYLANPFTQRCGLRDKPVEATDICFDFKTKTTPDSDQNETNI
ncbi:MAG: hypothetical protein KAH23_03820 [Kiritimatiellae bacterium]|nr:hypothetical protein [Kiritimatiellia bacterium]